jgi:hypothetical protein
MENKNKMGQGPLIFGCWELSHDIFLNLRKKELFAKLSKLSFENPVTSFPTAKN